MDKPQWIPVTERYPDPGTTVIASYDGTDVAIAFYDGHPEDYRFEAWVPFPEPYRGGAL